MKKENEVKIEKQEDKFLAELEKLTNENIDLFEKNCSDFVKVLFGDNKNFSLKRSYKSF